MCNYPITPPQDGHSIETVTVGYTFGGGTYSDIHSSASLPTLLNQMTGENTGKYMAIYFALSTTAGAPVNNMDLLQSQHG